MKIDQDFRDWKTPLRLKEQGGFTVADRRRAERLIMGVICAYWFAFSDGRARSA